MPAPAYQRELGAWCSTITEISFRPSGDVALTQTVESAQDDWTAATTNTAAAKHGHMRFMQELYHNP